MRRAAAVLALALAAACGGGSDGIDEQTAPEQTADTAIDPEAAAFVELARSAGEEPFRVRYLVVVPGDASAPEEDERADDDFFVTWSHRPPAEAFLLTDGDARSGFIDPGDGSGAITCTGGSCFRGAEGVVAPAVGPLRDLLEAVVTGELPDLRAQGTTTVAGRDARCATWTRFSAPTEVCLDQSTGALLSWEAGPADARWEAVEFGPPQPGDFEPFFPLR